MPSRTTVVLISALAAAIALPATFATGHGDPVIKLELKSKQPAKAQGVDNPPEGPSAGDLLVFSETLVNARGKRAGRDAAVCTQLFDASHACTGTYVLGGGQIMVQLIQPGPTGTYTQAITGGTGRYAGASGTVTVRQDPAEGDRFSFRIRVP